MGARNHVIRVIYAAEWVLSGNDLHKREHAMPVIIHRPQTSAPELRPRPRRRRLDDAVRALAPVIAEIRKAGHHGIVEIAMCLNDKGLFAPIRKLHAAKSRELMKQAGLI